MTSLLKTDGLQMTLQDSIEGTIEDKSRFLSSL